VRQCGAARGGAGQRGVAANHNQARTDRASPAPRAARHAAMVAHRVTVLAEADNRDKDRAQFLKRMYPLTKLDRAQPTISYLRGYLGLTTKLNHDTIY
jgi:hypothetical protein